MDESGLKATEDEHDRPIICVGICFEKLDVHEEKGS